MQKFDIECENCGRVCGSYDPGNVCGPPEKCYPPEYIKEPPFVSTINGQQREFCSLECQSIYCEERDLTDPEAT